MAVVTKFDERVAGQSVPQATPGPRKLGLTQVAAMSLATTAPVFGAISFVPLIAGGADGNGAGGAIPLAVLLSALASFGIAWTMARFSLKISNNGAVYAYISRSLGDRIGTAIGSQNFFTVVFVPLTPIAFGGTLELYLASRFGVHIPYWVLSIVFIAVIGLMVGLGVNFSSRAQFVWMTAAVVTIIVFSVVVIVRVLTSGAVPAAAPFHVGSSPGGWLGIFWGMLFGGFLFAGFESVQSVAEETRNPLRVIPLGMMITIGVLSVYYLLVGYATVVGFGMDGDALIQDPNPLLTLSGGAYGAPWLLDLMTVMLLVDIISMAVGICLYARGGVVALAQDSRWPAIFARMNTQGTPVFTTILQLTWMVVVVLITHFIVGPLVTTDDVDEYQAVFRWSAGFEGLNAAVVYAAVCLGGLVWLRRKDSRPIVLMVASILGLLSSCGAVYATFRGPAGPTIAGAAIIVVLFLGFFTHSTIQMRRGTYVPSLVRREDAESATDPGR